MRYTPRWPQPPLSSRNHGIHQFNDAMILGQKCRKPQHRLVGLPCLAFERTASIVHHADEAQDATAFGLFVHERVPARPPSRATGRCLVSGRQENPVARATSPSAGDVAHPDLHGRNCGPSTPTIVPECRAPLRGPSGKRDRLHLQDSPESPPTEVHCSDCLAIGDYISP